LGCGKGKSPVLVASLEALRGRGPTVKEKKKGGRECAKTSLQRTQSGGGVKEKRNPRKICQRKWGAGGAERRKEKKNQVTKSGSKSDIHGERRGGGKRGRDLRRESNLNNGGGVPVKLEMGT